MSASQQKIQSATYSIVFDIIRVFAMFGILAVHFSLQFPLPHIIKEVGKMGAHCVQIFFVISGYLGCSYFFRCSDSTVIEYYKKRSLRILPIYYAAILAAMIYVELFTQGFNKDVFYLGWARYYLGLNTLLPSADFWHWNNAFGFWTMTNFIVFYALIPFVIKIITTYKRSVILFIICYIIHCAVRLILKHSVTEAPFPDLNYMIWYSPLVQMQYFALGVLTFFAVKENKKSIAAILLIAIAMLPERFCSISLLYAVLTCLFIISVNDKDINITGIPKKSLQFISKYSFHIYLSHLLALSIAQRIAASFYFPPSLPYHLTTIIAWIIFTIIICYILELFQKLSNKIFT